MQPVVAQWLLALAGAPLVYSGWLHASDFALFRSVVVAHDLVPYRFHRSVAKLAVGGQLGVGGAATVQLLTPPMWAAWIATLVSLTYGVLAGYVGLLLRAGRAVPCGCFGTDEPISFRTLVRAVGLAAVGSACAAALWLAGTGDAGASAVPSP